MLFTQIGQSQCKKKTRIFQTIILWCFMMGNARVFDKQIDMIIWDVFEYASFILIIKIH
jgi:hypothetical protein